MQTITDGTIRVFTYREGLLSKVAHDLQFTLRRFSIEVDGATVRGRFWPGELRLDGVVRDGRVEPGVLSARDAREVHGNVVKILDTARHPEIALEATLDGDRLRGDLQMVGRRAPVECGVERAGGRYRGRVVLTPTRWGIQPYKALLGAIKLQDRVEVELDLPGAGG